MSRYLGVSFVGVCAVAAVLTACGGGGGGASGAQLVTLADLTPPNAATGQHYSVTFVATFPHAPGTYSVTGGGLPPGLKLDTDTGELSGYPRVAGDYKFKISAQDGVDPALLKGRDVSFAEAVREYSLRVELGAPTILPQFLPPAQYRASYAYQIDVAGGTAPYSFAKTGGSLPSGLQISPTGVVGTAPLAALEHPYQFFVTVTDAKGLEDTTQLSVEVVVLPLIIQKSPLPIGNLFVPYDATLPLASKGGGSPFTWSQLPVDAGSGETNLADIGMTITGDGHLANLPPATGPTLLSPPGGFLFTAKVTDEAGQIATMQLKLSVLPLVPGLTSITPAFAGAAPTTFTVKGTNFAPGAQLTFKPGGPGPVTITPTYVNATTLTFGPSAPASPPGGGFVTVRVLNPDTQFADLPNGFAFALGTLSFGTKFFLPSTLSSTGLASADLNGDGKADIVHCGAAGITPISSSASPSPAPLPLPVPPTGSTPSSTTGGLDLLINTGGVTFARTSLDSGNYYDVEIADVNNDGTPDIVALGATSIRTWLNNAAGTGAFTAGPSTTHTSPLFPTDMTICSLNGDLLPDVVFGTANSTLTTGNCYAFTGNGNGSFTQVDAATSTMTGTYGVYSVGALDFDGDGRQDVVAGGYGQKFTTSPVFRTSNTMASGAFGSWSNSATTTGFGYFHTYTIAAGNFFGNGTPAAVIAGCSDPYDGGNRSLEVYSGTNLSTQMTLAAPTGLPKCVGTGDWDLDGKTDFALSMAGGYYAPLGTPAPPTLPGLINVYRGASLGAGATFTQQLNAATGSPSIASPFTGRIASGDVDGDSRPDLLCATAFWCLDRQNSSSFLVYTWGETTKGIVIYLNSSN